MYDYLEKDYIESIIDTIINNKLQGFPYNIELESMANVYTDYPTFVNILIATINYTKIPTDNTSFDDFKKTIIKTLIQNYKITGYSFESIYNHFFKNKQIESYKTT